MAPQGMEMVVIGDEEAPMEDEVDSPEVLANELLSIAQRISDMLGQDASVTSLPPEEDPMMEEKMIIGFKMPKRILKDAVPKGFALAKILVAKNALPALNDII